MRHSDKTRGVAAAVLLATLLAGCSDIYLDRRATVTFAAGDALATAQATQVINPWPAASADRNIRHDGNVIASAVARYRTCQVIQPKGTASSGKNYGNAPQPPQPGCTPAPAGAAGATTTTTTTATQ